MLRIDIAAIQTVQEKKLLRMDDETRIFVVGDLDGNLNSLLIELKKVNFSRSKDHLICTGDIIDRGEDNIELLNFLKDLKASLTLGNHEHLMLESVISNSKISKKLWSSVGGDWQNNVHRDTLVQMCEFLLSHSLSIVLEYRGYKVGFSHTLPQSWNWTKFPKNKVETIDSLLWNRKLFNSKRLINNIGVDFSIHGHNSTNIPLWIGNSYHIDTSYYGAPSIVELETLVLEGSFKV